MEKQNEKQSEQPIHLLDFISRYEVIALRKQLEERMDEHCELSESHMNLTIAHALTVASLDSQSKILLDQAKELKRVKKQLIEMDTWKMLAIMAEHVFNGALDKTGLDYIKRVQEARERMFVPSLTESLNEIKK